MESIENVYDRLQENTNLDAFGILTLDNYVTSPSFDEVRFREDFCTEIEKFSFTTRQNAIYFLSKCYNHKVEAFYKLIFDNPDTDIIKLASEIKREKMYEDLETLIIRLSEEIDDF